MHEAGHSQVSIAVALGVHLLSEAQEAEVKQLITGQVPGSAEAAVRALGPGG